MDENFIINSSDNSIKNARKNFNIIKKRKIEKNITFIQKEKANTLPYEGRIFDECYKKKKKKKKKKKSKTLNSPNSDYDCDNDYYYDDNYECNENIFERKNSIMLNMNEKLYKRKLKMYGNNEDTVKNKEKKSKSESNEEEDHNRRKRIFFINKYILERKEINTINNNKIRETISCCNPEKLCLVKFLCQAKSYDLLKISKVFFSKKIRYNFFDDDNVLCVFLTPESCIKNFYSSEDIYKIDNLDLKKNVTYLHTKYIFFIFKNGSVVIWEKFKNSQNSDYFINKVIVFLNSFSDELLPVYIVQLDTIFYYEEEKNKEEIEEEKSKEKNKEEREKEKEKKKEEKEKEEKEKEKEKKKEKEKEEKTEEKEEEEEEEKKKKCFVNNGIIYLTNDSLEQKLTASFALSQSIRLDVHEMMMDIAINTLFNISKEIASKGTCTISKKKISSMLDVYSSIINVNAVQDFLDIPEYFWNKVQYEHLWFEIYKYMEIPERIKILNKRYNYYKDFLKVIKTEIYNKKTFYCYRIVVLLLFIHILALILNDLFFMK